MSGSGTPRSGRGGRTKSGKPRPGTGGHGKRRLEGKGPTPPAHLRPGHPAQQRAAAAARAEQEPGRSRAPADRASRTAASPPGSRGPALSRPGPDGPVPSRPRVAARPRGAGDATEIVAGRNAVLEALEAGVPATALYAGPRDGGGRGREAITLAAQAGIPMIEVGRGELDRVTGGSIHQGLALRIRPYDYAAPEDLLDRARAAGQAPLIVALDGVTDPRNLGAIARSAAAFGGHGVLIASRRSARVSAGAWKASAGALARLPVALAPNLARALTAYQEAGLFAVGLDASGTVEIGDVEVASGPVVLVIGSEGRGLSRLVADRCDLIAAIPVATESLNAGVAAGIALHEVARRRRAGRGS